MHVRDKRLIVIDSANERSVVISVSQGMSIRVATF